MASKKRILSTVIGVTALLTAAVNLSAVTWASERPAAPRVPSQAAALTALADLSVPGTTWSADPATGKIAVTYDDTVTGPAMTRLRAVTGPLGTAVTVVREPGTLTRRSGGDDIRADDGTGIITGCSLGFSGTRGNTKKAYFITAGHCGATGVRWRTPDGHTVGTITESTFPGADYALGEYAPNAQRANTVTLGGGKVQDISHAGTATIGQRVTRKGATTGVHTGSVIALNVTAVYPEGKVQGLIKTDICAEPGDSGGPLFAGDAGLGLLSGGKGNCTTTGGVSYYQPVQAALDAYGLTLY
jgi:streptogrisin D